MDSKHDEARQILKEINDETTAVNRVGREYSKFVGAITAEVIRKHLTDQGFCVSRRDVFIRGLALEIDLLITKHQVKPAHGLIYEPSDVLAALEIKRSGSFTKDTPIRLKDSFQKIQHCDGAKIRCAYVTLQELKSYRHQPKKCDEFEVFTLFWFERYSQIEPTVSEDGNNWGGFVQWLQRLS